MALPERYRILVVDDDEVDRMAVRRALRAAGVPSECDEAGDAPSALAAMRAGGYHCVFLDYQLPGGDGLSVLRTARAEGLTVPIIMLTGRGDQETAVELMKAGASDFVAKGTFTPERLAQGLRHAVRVHAAEQQAREAEAALRESEERFRVLHETSPDGFMILRAVWGADGEVQDFEWVYVNPAAERILQLPAAQLRGRRLLEVLPGTRELGLFDAYVEVVRSRAPMQREVAIEGEDGRAAWFRISAAPLGDGFAVAFSDVSARRRAEEEREAAIASRSRFYAAMSHELRTPINAILGYNDLILSGVYGAMLPPQEKGLERAQRAARHLLDLVNDVLDLSKLEAGKLEVEAEAVSVPELVRDLFATVRPLAEDKGSALRMVEEADPRPVLTDPRRVRQIVLNLLSNAIKFGESRPVEVRVRGMEDGGVQVEVADQGQGVAGEHLDRIFEEFVQLPNANAGGTGLGLPISRRLAELLGGRLEAESRPGQGSTFRLTLPRLFPGDPAAAAQAQADPPLSAAAPA